MNLPIDTYFSATNFTTKQLQFTNFTFAIPTGSVIVGVDVNITTTGTGEGNQAYNALAQLLVPNGGVSVIAGQSRTKRDINFIDNNSHLVSTDFATGVSDVWGTSLTPAIVNDSLFGVSLQFNQTTHIYFQYGDRAHLRIASLTMSIFYSIGGLTMMVQENVLYGSKTDGKVYILSEYVFTDDVDNILFVRRTGVYTHGTLSRKRVKRLHLRLSSGLASNRIKQTLTLSYNDNHQDRWSNTAKDIIIDLASDDNIPDSTSIERVLFRLETYRTRQYQITTTDAIPLIFVELEEVVDALRD